MAYKVTYRVFGESKQKINGVWGKHVNPKNFVDVTLYVNRGDMAADGSGLLAKDGGINMKALKGHIRHEIGDTFYQFQEIVKVGETI